MSVDNKFVVHTIGEQTNARLIKYVERTFDTNDPQEEQITQTLEYIVDKFLDEEEQAWGGR